MREKGSRPLREIGACHTRPMATVLIALGTNVGDRLENLQRAVDALRSLIQIHLVSAVYETAPMYVTDQGPFYNAALKASTDLGPRALLAVLKQCEAHLGRQDRPRFGPREIDLDLISYGQLIYRFEGAERTLQVPHPRSPERRFVLAPLADVAPNVNLPGFGRVSDLLQQTSTPAEHVVKLPNAILSIRSH